MWCGSGTVNSFWKHSIPFFHLFWQNFFLTLCEMLPAAPLLPKKHKTTFTNLRDTKAMTVTYETKDGKEETVHFTNLVGARLITYTNLESMVEPGRKGLQPG